MHLDIAILSTLLLALAVAILCLCASFLLRPRRPTPRRFHERNENFEDVLCAVESALPPLPFHEDDAQNKPTDFVFRRKFIQEQEAASATDAQHLPPPPAKIAFSTIQDEIRAALSQATKASPTATAPALPTLNWTETGRLAVLSLSHAAPETAWSLLQAQDIHILIVPQNHPFSTTNRMIELICLSSYNDASMPDLIAKLRAKLTKGERIAFYTETGLSGASAFLAARLSGRGMA